MIAASAKSSVVPVLCLRTTRGEGFEARKTDNSILKATERDKADFIFYHYGAEIHIEELPFPMAILNGHLESFYDHIW